MLLRRLFQWKSLIILMHIDSAISMEDRTAAAEEVTIAVIGNLLYTVCLFGSQECPKKRLTRNHRQNCRIGQPSAKKWFFSPDQFGPWPERKGKSGEIRSLLETLGGTLYPRKKNYLYKTWYGQQLLLVNFFCATHPTRGSLSKIETDQYYSP